MKRKLIDRILDVSHVLAGIAAIIDDDLAWIASAIEIVQVIRAKLEDRVQRRQLR